MGKKSKHPQSIFSVKYALLYNDQRINLMKANIHNGKHCDRTQLNSLPNRLNSTELFRWLSLLLRNVQFKNKVKHYSIY